MRAKHLTQYIVYRITVLVLLLEAWEKKLEGVLKSIVTLSGCAYIMDENFEITLN